MPVKKLYNAVLQTIEALMDIDPDPKTPEGRLLSGLESAIEEYEKAEEEHEQENSSFR